MSDSHIPIEISVAKLLDWLTSRRHCSKDWQQNIGAVREKISNAIRDMPEVDEIRELLSGSFINYYNCKRIVEILKETEKDSKSFFGSYSSQRMKDWLDIVRLYEADNLFLADAATQLSRTLTYEIPSMKRQIVRCNQQQQECLTKAETYLKNNTDVLSQFRAECDKLGIKGQNMKSELMALLKELPVVFDEAVAQLQNIRPTVDFYRNFVGYTQAEELSDAEFLPIIHYILSKGNTTTYEWRTGRVPDVVQELRPSSPVVADIVVEDAIDFGDLDEATSVGTSQSNGDFIHLDGEIDGDDNISWDISVQDDGSGNGNGDSTGSNEGGANVAKGTDALSVLHNPTTREMFMNELREIECFLTQRDAEMKIEGDVIIVDILQSAPLLIQQQTRTTVSAMSAQIKKLLASLSTHKMIQLYALQSSPKHVDRLVEQLGHKLQLSEKYLLSRQAVLTRREETLLEQEKLEPQLTLIVQKSKLLKEQIEGTISQKYNKRPVHLIGSNL